jgi:hypothetical protein
MCFAIQAGNLSSSVDVVEMVHYYTGAKELEQGVGLTNTQTLRGSTDPGCAEQMKML